MSSSPVSSSPRQTPFEAVFLQPHRDDICFSLGAFAARQRNGLMLTIFTVSAWVHPKVFKVRPSSDEITKMRMAEDQAFADDARLTLGSMALPEAPLMGWRSRDLTRALENHKRIELPLLAELMKMADHRRGVDRPWLFCPATIGGHVDHAAALFTVLSNIRELSRHFRIAFYEDLHYASRWRVRMAGLTRFFAETQDLKLKRWIFPLDENSIKRKCALIAHYGSQIARAPTDLGDYSPSTIPRSPPHEAIWTAEQPPEGFRIAPPIEMGESLARLLAKLQENPLTPL